MKGVRPGLAAPLFAVLFSACASVPSSRTVPMARPDEAAISEHTLVKARTVEIVLSDHWRKDSHLEGIDVSTDAEGRRIAHGGAVFTVGKLRAEARDSISVRFLKNQENFLLYAQDVSVFERSKTYSHRSEKLSAVTMANGQVTLLP